jgi:hypothetical protein
MKYQITHVPSFLYSIGVNYHATGTITLGKDKIFDFYKIDSITSEQIEQIKAWCPHFEQSQTFAGYVPELTSKILCFPKKAFFRINQDVAKRLMTGTK